MKKRIIPFIGVLVLLFMALPVTQVSAAVGETLEGYTLAPHEGWTGGDIKGYVDGDCIPFRYTVENKGGDSVSLNLTLEFSHKAADGTIGIVDFESFDIPAGSISGPIIDGSGFYYWSVTVPPHTTYNLTWCARLSNEASLWPGAKIHIRASGRDVSIQIPGPAGATTLDLTPPSATNVLPGDTSHNFTVTVKDQYGSPMVGQVVNLSTTFGTLSTNQVTTGIDGTATFSISSDIEGTATITATLGDLSDTSTKIWTVRFTPAGAGGGAGCPSRKYLTVDWEGNNTTKPLYSNNKLAVNLTGPSPDTSDNLFLERGTHAPVVDERTYYLIVVRELEEIPPVPENYQAIVVLNITPTDAEFNKDILLTLGLNQTQLPENAQNVTMAYYDDVNGLWETLDYEAGGPNGVAELTLSALINHFSIYGVLAQLAPTPPPAHFAASGLSIISSVEKTTFVTKTGETVTITANVANDGGQSGTYTVELKLNGETVDTKIVTLGAGQSQQVSFTRSGLDDGQYQVNVAGLSGSFTASRTITWWLIIVIIAAIGLIIWGVVWGRRRRKAHQEA
jgi:hypothetical protein